MGDRSNQIVTTASLFSDGTAIDQLKDQRLMLWRQGQSQVAPTVDHAGITYMAASLDAHLEHLLHLPAGADDFGSTEQLIADLSGEVLTRYPGLDQDATLLAATAITGTWVVDLLPGPLIINLWGPRGTETPLLDLLRCLCRRPLCLLEPPLQALASLPVSTMILRHPSDRVLQRLVAAAGEPNTCFVSGGKVAQVRCAIVAATYKPITLPAVTIAVAAGTGTLHRITACEEKSLTERLLPRLLDYRLKNHLSVVNSQFDAPGFCPEVRMLARTLGAALEGSPELQVRITDALRRFDEQRRGEQSQTRAAVVLESVLTLSHGGAPAAFVGRICDVANSFLENRDDPTRLSAKAVGDIMRDELGLDTHRRAPGYQLAFDPHIQRRVHRIAAAYGVLQHTATCTWCREMVVAVPAENPTSTT